MLTGDQSTTATVSAEEGEKFGPSQQPSLLRILMYAGCVSLLFALIAINFVDVDIWHQMNLIRESLAAGHLLTVDPFAYTPTITPMIDHEWGSGAIAFFTAKWLGGTGIILLKLTAALGTLLIVLRVAELRGATLAALSFLAPIGIGLLYLTFLPTVRAQAYSCLFTSYLLWILEMDRRGARRWLIGWLITFPVWVNLHAGFVVGIGFVFLYAIERVVVRKPCIHVIGMGCLMLMEVFINPYGAKYFAYLAKALPMARPRIGEWRPLWTLDWPFTAAFAFAIIVFWYSLVKFKPWLAPGILLLTASAIEGLLHRKLLPFFAITWLSYIPAYFANTPAGQWLQQFVRRRSKFLILGWSFIIIVCVVAAVQQKFWIVQVPQVSGPASYPVGAVEYLSAQSFHGNVMTPFGVGAYVSWKLFPAVKVAVDSRYEVAYPEGWVEKIYRFYEASPGWQQTVSAYPTDMILTPTTAPVRSLIPSIGWKLIYADRQFEIYARPRLNLPFVRREDPTMAGRFP